MIEYDDDDEEPQLSEAEEQEAVMDMFRYMAQQLRPDLHPPPPQFEGVNRNDPCPCGSGKKFKKCHGVESA